MFKISCTFITLFFKITFFSIIFVSHKLLFQLFYYDTFMRCFQNFPHTYFFLCRFQKLLWLVYALFLESFGTWYAFSRNLLSLRRNFGLHHKFYMLRAQKMYMIKLQFSSIIFSVRPTEICWCAYHKTVINFFYDQFMIYSCLTFGTLDPGVPYRT